MVQFLAVDGSQLRRLVKLCRTLNAGKGVSVQQLIKKLGTSRRTVFRDLNMLQEVGVHVELGSEGYVIKQKIGSCKKLIADYYTKALDRLLNSCLK
ncbi:MAG: HTH domain-containing protein [Phycisphaerales bacterium]|nr:HTH domain-containing protein [Phycisphaerales bacterium]